MGKNEELDKNATNKKYSGIVMNEQPCISVWNDFTNRQSTGKIDKVAGHNKEVRTFPSVNGFI